MKKFHDWATRLDKYFNECADKEFKYGVFDCWIFVADGILAMTGEDIIFKFARGYETESEAVILMKKAKPNSNHMPKLAVFEFLVNTVAKECKFKQVNINFAKRGDVSLMDQALNNSLGFVDLSGRYVIFPHPKKGIMRAPLKYGYKFWSIN